MDGFIALDLGTTGVKAALFDERGRMLSDASQEQRLSFSAPGRAEQNPESWYELPCALIRAALEKAGADGACVRGIGLSSQGISFVPTDADFRPLRDGISWLDTRAEGEMDDLYRAFPRARLWEMTGKHAGCAYTLPKLLYLQKRETAVFCAARWFLMPLDYCTARMTGKAVTDPTMAGGTMLADLRGQWRADIADAFGIPLFKLPRVAPGGSTAGYLNAESASRAGLREGVPVAVGAQDQKIAAYGANLAEGAPTLSLGTAGAMEFLSDAASETLPAFPYVDGRGIVLEACVNTAGAAIRWARDILFPGEGYESLSEAASRAPIGANGAVFRPHLSGAGTPHIGQSLAGAFEGLTLRCGRDDMARALYEGLACEIRWNIEEARKAGARADSLTAFGGGTGSDALLACIAGVCDVPIRVKAQREMGLLGAARTAAGVAGFDASHFGEDTAREITSKDVRAYQAVYERYRTV